MRGVGQPAGADADRGQIRQQSELRELADGVRKRVDADAQRPHVRGRLENDGFDPAPVQHQRKRQAADAPARNDHPHGGASGRPGA